MSHIPEEVIHSDLVEYFTNTDHGGDRIHYLLYPLGADNTTALVAYKHPKGRTSQSLGTCKI